jgi:hypothetical protein
MGDFFRSLGFDSSPSSSYMGGEDYLKKSGVESSFFDFLDSSKVDSTPSGYLGGMDFANEYETFDPFGPYSGPDLSYEPEDLGGMESNYSESPRFSDYLKKYGSAGLEALGSSGKMPEDLVYEGGRLMSGGYSGPSGRGGGFRGVGDTLRAKEYLTADQYERLMEDRLKLALADFIRQSKINPLV